MAALSDPDLRLLDASWHLDGRDAMADFTTAHIPGALFFDLEAASDQDNPLPHMLPSPAAFAAFAGAMGIAETDRMVVYDTTGLFSAARVWWMFRLMGAQRVQVLDGGMPAWVAAGGAVEAGPARALAPVIFTPDFDPHQVTDMDGVRHALTGTAQVVDARGAARFRGHAAEPRPGVRPGHMPGAINLPYSALLTPEGRMKPPAELTQAFADAGIDLDRPIVTSCGSGVTAAILSLGLVVLDGPSRLYDGSWAEWGSRADTPVQTS
jgi:thiosulfate/3-mercaptopyruvate sulfurtransferase